MGKLNLEMTICRCGLKYSYQNYCHALYSKKETAIANQLLRSGMAVGSNISEAQQAEAEQILFIK